MCPQGFRGGQRRRDMDASELPDKEKVPLPQLWKSEEHVVINGRNTEKKKEGKKTDSLKTDECES